MKHKSRWTIVLAVCFFAFVGAIGHKVEIVTNNGGPLIDLNAQLVNDDPYKPEDNDKETVEYEPVVSKKTVYINIKYDRVQFYGREYVYKGHEEENADVEELIWESNGESESFDDALKRYIKNEGISENDVFMIKDKYGEYYTEKYVVSKLEEAAIEKIEFDSDYK